MTAQMDGHVRLDERGVAYVGDTRLKLIHLVIAFQIEEGSFEGLRRYYDWLSAADAHAALAYYFDHQSEIDAQIEAYHDFSRKARDAAGESELARRVKAMRSQ